MKADSWRARIDNGFNNSVLSGVGRIDGRVYDHVPETHCPSVRTPTKSSLSEIGILAFDDILTLLKPEGSLTFVE